MSSLLSLDILHYICTAKLLSGIVARRRKQKSKAGLMTNGTCNLRQTFFKGWMDYLSGTRLTFHVVFFISKFNLRRLLCTM